MEKEGVRQCLNNQKDKSSKNRNEAIAQQSHTAGQISNNSGTSSKSKDQSKDSNHSKKSNK